MHTYWNCSRCHWCLMSRPLQSNQRDPLQKERGRRARGHPGCHQALPTQGRATLASRKPCAPAPTGTSLCRTGRAASLTLCWQTGDVQQGEHLATVGEGRDAGRRLLSRCWASQGEGGKVEWMGRRVLAGGAGAACTWRGGRGGHGSTPARGRGSLSLGTGLGLTETRQ